MRRLICISHTDGAGGEEIGRAVAEEMVLRYVDDEIVIRAAEREDLEVDEVMEVEKRRSFLERVLEPSQPAPSIPAAAMADASFSALGAATGSGKERYRELIRQVIRGTADRGDAVIVAHAASLALGERPGVLRVLITASEERRAARIAEVGELDEREALKRVVEADKGRVDYLRSFYGIREEQSTHYDLVINTDALDIKNAVRIVIAAAD